MFRDLCFEAELQYLLKENNKLKNLWKKKSRLNGSYFFVCVIEKIINSCLCISIPLHVSRVISLWLAQCFILLLGPLLLWTKILASFVCSELLLKSWELALVTYESTE